MPLPRQIIGGKRSTIAWPMLWNVSTRLLPPSEPRFKRDRANYLASLVAQLETTDQRRPKALYKAVRKAFPTARSARRSAFQPLPSVRLSNGELAQTLEERQQRWIEYFGSQEAGQIVSPQAYVQAFRAPDVEVFPAGPSFQLSMVPTLHELEQQMLRSKLHKACGPDGITAEIFRLSVPQIAKLLLPISLKASLGAREPVEWRGGCLLCLAKKAQAALGLQGLPIDPDG